MITNKKTIDYNDKVNEDCEKIIDSLLEELPDYCTDFNISRQLKVQPRTRMENLRDLTVFFNWFHTRNRLASKYNIKDIPVELLGKLNAFDFDDFSGYLSKNMDKPAVKRKLSSVRPFFTFLYRRGFIESNPSQLIELPSIPKKKAENTIILEREDRPRFFKAIDDEIKEAYDRVNIEASENDGYVTRQIKILPALAVRNKAIIYILLHTGVRVSELCAMNCADFSVERRSINIIRKGGKADTVYLSKDALKYLVDYLDNYRDLLSPNNDNYDAMFISAKRCRINPRAVETAVKKVANRALGENNKISPHKLRATFGTEYYNQKKDIKASSKAMGHESMQTTATYYVRDNQDAMMDAADIKF